MPELPEVETVRRGLEPVLVGRRLARVEVLDERLVRPLAPRDVERALTGHVVGAVERRGKYLLIRFADVDLVAVHHLRMTGSFAAPGQPEPSHVRLRYHLDRSAGAVAYNDPRRFGTLLLGSDAEVA